MRTRAVRVGASALVVLASVVAAAPTALSVMGCTFDDGEVVVQLGGEHATISIGANDEILVNGVPCGDGEGVATRKRTTDIQVLGSAGDDAVAFDQGGPGGTFAPWVDISVSLAQGAGDRLLVIGTDGDDSMMAMGGRIDIALDGPSVWFGEVELLEVDAGAGDDEVDAGVIDADLGRLGIPITIRGGPGTDVLAGGSADDRLYGGPQPDRLDGGEGLDLVSGGEDDDVCRYADVDAYLPCDHTIAVEPTSGTTGTPVVVTGVGWHPENGTIEIHLGAPDTRTPLATATPGPDGSFTARFEVPDIDEGEASTTVLACQACTEPEPMIDEERFAIEAAAEGPSVSVTPDRASPGDTASASGAGWTPGETVSLFVDPVDVATDEPVASAIPGDDGLFDATFVVPVVPSGRREVVACQACGTPEGTLARAAIRILDESVSAAPADGSTGRDRAIAVIAALVLAAAGAALVRGRLRRRVREGRRPPRPRSVRARARLGVPSVDVAVEPDGSTERTIRLIPYRDAATQRVEEMSRR